MPRPKNKEELLSIGAKNFDKLLELVGSYSPEEQERSFPPGTLNRNIRDVFGHLHHWHLLCLGWYADAEAGKKPALPAEGYTWKTTPELNRFIQQKYSAVSLIEIRRLLMSSYEQVRELIEQHTEEELFTKKYYKWTGSTSLGAYLISATSSHYDWAFKLIKKSKKERSATSV